jgi:cytidine deaminase
MTFDANMLVQHAIRASERAYVPYSHYHVGAALLAADGTIYTGCNVENASYPVCICGERTALVKAVSEGAREFTAIAVATINGGSPCGVCRQMLYEFAPDLTVIIADFEGRVHHTYILRDLLPDGFGPRDLPAP